MDGNVSRGERKNAVGNGLIAGRHRHGSGDREPVPRTIERQRNAERDI
jgi:hypothetical protein